MGACEDKQIERENKIIKLLESYPEGLSAAEISKKMDINKMTIGSDLGRLVWKDKGIVRRVLGTTKLYYHKMHTKKFRDNYDNKIPSS